MRCQRLPSRLPSPSRSPHPFPRAPQAGLPALVLPCGTAPASAAAGAAAMPVGMQLIGALWDEDSLLRIGNAYEVGVLDFGTRWPSLGPAGPTRTRS